MTSPFTTDAVYYGGDPGDPVFWREGGFAFWLGSPGQMIELPSPNPGGYTANGSKGEVAQGLFGGGSAVTMFDSLTRAWSMQWPLSAGRDWNVVDGFARRLFKGEPWCFLNPEDVNRLTLTQSLCGALHGAVEGWAVTGGVLALATATAPFPPAGVLGWTPAASGNYLVPNAGSTTVPDPTFACPYVPGLPWTFSCLVAAVTGTVTVTPRLHGRKADGTSTGVVNGAAQTIGTTWTEVTVTADPTALGNDATAQYVLPSLLAGSTGQILVSTPMLTESNVTDWSAGTGVPRVNITAGLGRAPGAQMTSAATLQLAEAYPGAA